MQVILLKKVDNLGTLGSLVNVKAGYGRNYLIPQGFAKAATASNIADFEARRAELEAEEKALLDAANARAAHLNELTVTIAARTADETKLFGSVGTIDIAKAVEQAGAEIEKSEIRMPEGPIRHTGEFDIEIHLHSDVNATIKVVVVAED